MPRRPPLSLPYEDQVPALAALMGPAQAQAEPPTDADRLVEAAVYHKVTGHLADAVGRAEVRLDRQRRTNLARIGAIQAVQASALRRELEQIAPILEEACGEPPVCIKGPATADLLYPDLRLRSYSDLDLLVGRDSLDRGARALIAQGYQLLHAYRPGFRERYGHAVHLFREVGSRRLDVELHWRIGDDPACSVLDRATVGAAGRLDLGGTQVAVPALPEHLLCLAVHLLGDRAKRLIWVQDLALAGRRARDGEWRRTFELGRGLGLTWALHRALDYAARHLHFERERPLPAGPPPAWGPLRAVEELDLRASGHLGQLAALGWIGRGRYLRAVLVPTRAGLAGTVGDEDGAPGWRLAGRHVRAMAVGLRGQRR